MVMITTVIIIIAVTFMGHQSGAKIGVFHELSQSS
jgi:hypothetical protein